MTPSLSEAFLACAPASASVDRRALEECLEAFVARARADWPDLPISPEHFTRYVAERLVDDADPTRTLPTLCAGDLLLACGCAVDLEPAVRAFDEAILSAVPPAVRRVAKTDLAIEEVTQLTRMRLLVAEPGRARRIATYQGRGRLRSWVQVAAVRIALELARRQRPEESSDDDLADLTDVDGSDPELQHIRCLYRAEFATAFKDALGSLAARDRNVLRMYALDGLNIDEIGAVYHVHRATIARWIAKSRETLLAETRARLMHRLRLSPMEFESLMHVVRSHLELSLDRFLKDPGDT